MTVTYLEVLVEELSAERALISLLPRIVPGINVAVRTFRGKPDLLKKLPGRLAGYAAYAETAGLGVVVLTDRDADDCHELKARLEAMADTAGLPTLAKGAGAVVANRIACEELEAWFFGDVPALAAAFPGVPVSLGEKAGFRDPDAIAGGTAEALERVLQQHGHHRAGLNKVAAAAAVATHMDVETNRSPSFTMFRDGVRRLVGGEH